MTYDKLFTVSFHDTMLAKNEDHAYELFLGYLSDCVENQDLTAFGFTLGGDDPAPAIKHLSNTERGRRVLALLHDLHREVCHLDSGNTEALSTVTTAMCGHQLNGTLMDLLTPYKT